MYIYKRIHKNIWMVQPESESEEMWLHIKYDELNRKLV